jgi:Flp pilus assembly protein TadD
VALDYVLLNAYDDADKWITHAAHDDPADGETWYAMGRIKYTENRFTEAVDSFEHALALMPRSVKAEDNLGLALEGLNRPDDAVAAYRRAIAWQAASPHPSEQPLLNLGILLTDRNQLDEALPLLTQAEALVPKDPRVHGALGKLYARRQTYPQARAELELAVAADPQNSGLHFQLGQVYRKLGLSDRAAAELQQAAAVESKTRR